MTNKQYLIGVDVGGTFTDLLAYHEEKGQLLAAKVPSLPGEQWQGVLNALIQLDIDFDDIRAFVHGTTIATNTLLQRRGAKTAMITTEGFRDVIEIGKGRRLIGGIFDAAWQRPEPLVPRDQRYEVQERTTATGEILTPIDICSCDEIFKTIRKQNIEAIAVTFLNSYLNSKNELVLAAFLREKLPKIPVTESATLIPERGEFERGSTAVLNAYLTPVVTSYLEMLEQELSNRGITAPVNVMGSNGGAMTLEDAAKRCASTFLSGPVGGVVGAVQVAEGSSVRDMITFDMGGTSTDVALVHSLTPRMSHDNQIDAFPLRMPQLDIHTIGAGGGSIIWVGPDGTLQIGPQSAGASPGPACYGKGGIRPTISDANLLLGRLTIDRPLAGGLTLDRVAASDAFSSVSRALKTEDLIGIADAALTIAVAKMAGAVREVSVHRGFDPRNFTLIGFGGAGPMHGFLVAEELGMSEILIPRLPGHLSALGQMMADLRRDFVKAWGGTLNESSLDKLRQEAEILRQEGKEILRREGIPCERHLNEFTLDIRYEGQSFTLPIQWNPNEKNLESLRRAFDSRHEETFGYADSSNDAEIVNIRLVAIGLIDKPKISYTPPKKTAIKSVHRKVWFDKWVDTPIYDRDSLEIGSQFQGPAIIEEAGGTSVVPAGWSISIHTNGELFCRRKY